MRAIRAIGGTLHRFWKGKDGPVTVIPALWAAAASDLGGGPPVAAQLERGIGAVEKLHSREQQLGVANVLYLVDHELAILEGELLAVAWLVGAVRHAVAAELRDGGAGC